LYAEAIPLLRTLGNRGECVALHQAALAALELGDPEQARVLAAQCETRGRAWNHPVAVAAAQSVQGTIAGRAGDTELAVRLLEASLDEQRRTSHQQGIVISLTELGHVLLDQARIEQARVAFAEAMRTLCISGERNRLPPALDGLARSFARSHPESALSIAAAADAQRKLLAAVPWPSDVQRSAWQAAVRRKLGTRASAAAWEAGRHLSPEDALDLVNTAQREAAAQPALLTAREREVTKLLVRGFSNRQIANTLHISVATVRTHLDHILAKLDLHTRVEVAVWAAQGGPSTARTSEPED
jgi:DNA-binding CsgD family transcriptional regulator